MRSSVIYSVTAAIIALLAVGPPSTTGSLVPWWLHRSERPLSDRFPDPFRILEHTPFGFERDEAAVVSVDWRETPTSHEIVIDVPGMKKEELKIEMEENRILRVSGERKREEEEKGEHWHRVERSHGKFWRQFRLPDNADIDAVAAKLEDGVLTIKFAKLAPEQIKGSRVVSIAGEDGGVAEKLTAGEAKKIEL